jgi:Leucine-rich repeat (LRR) protein
VITKNKLKTLPSPLPPALRLLYASNNRLQTLPTHFPSNLTNLSIHNNYVTKFPNLPPTVKLLYASFNEFTELSSSMPPSMTQCIMAGNHFLVPQTRADEEGVGLTTWIQTVQEAQEQQSKQRILARTEQIKEELLGLLFSPERIMSLFKEGLLFSLMTDHSVAEAAASDHYWIAK